MDAELKKPELIQTDKCRSWGRHTTVCCYGVRRVSFIRQHTTVLDIRLFVWIHLICGEVRLIFPFDSQIWNAFHANLYRRM